MRKISKIVFSVIILTSIPVWGDTYQWTDDEGVMHFSDDVSSKPKKFRYSVKKNEGAISIQQIPPVTMNKSKESKQDDNAGRIDHEKYKRGSAEFQILEGQLITSWNRMRQELRAKRIEAVLTYFLESSRSSFRDQFTKLRNQLPKIADEMGEPRLVKVTDDSIAECDLRTIENGTEMSYMLQFVRDYDGIWRIHTF